jgi:hypothetical protein
MIKLRYKLLAAVILWTWFLVQVCGFGCAKHPQVAPVLPVNDKEQIIVDPVKHQLIIVRPGKTTVTTLPDRRSTIDVKKDGSVSVTAPQFGFEHAPFVGAFYSNRLRFGAGLDGLYFKKLDLGLGVAGGSSTNTVLFLQMSYGLWDNLRIGATYDHQQHVGIGITVRI